MYKEIMSSILDFLSEEKRISSGEVHISLEI